AVEVGHDEQVDQGLGGAAAARGDWDARHDSLRRWRPGAADDGSDENRLGERGDALARITVDSRGRNGRSVQTGCRVGVTRVGGFARPAFQPRRSASQSPTAYAVG